MTAPMTGVSDLPFRRAASKLGAPYVATEMVACDAFARGRPDVVRRAAVGAAPQPFGRLAPALLADEYSCWTLRHQRIRELGNWIVG